MDLTLEEEALNPNTSGDRLREMFAIAAATDREIRRLSWTNEQGRNYLIQAYGKRSRHLLTDEELLEFLNYLRSLE